MDRFLILHGYYGIALCLALCLYITFIVVAATFKVCTTVVRVFHWICGCIPWGRAFELGRLRERDVVLKEALNARQARTHSLEIEIEVCKRLLETLNDLVSSAEDRVLELEEEKELLLRVTVRAEGETLDQKLNTFLSSERDNEKSQACNATSRTQEETNIGTSINRLPRSRSVNSDEICYIAIVSTLLKVSVQDRLRVGEDRKPWDIDRWYL
ncbi:hypothetical protein C8R42DRAFT_649097 [Lentinula raphanica]|nr:hypothetical protein C8R42DRAFT_649097 [Lentinula raphanica]